MRGCCCAFDNRAANGEQEVKVMELMGLVEELVRDHGVNPYTKDVMLSKPTEGKLFVVLKNTLMFD